MPSDLILKRIKRLLNSSIMHELTSEEIKKLDIISPKTVQALSDKIDQQIVDNLIKEK